MDDLLSGCSQRTLGYMPSSRLACSLALACAASLVMACGRGDAEDCSVRGQNVYLRGCVLSNAVLTGVDLTNANLEGANLAETDLRFAVLTSANLTNANLSGVSSGGIVGVPAALPSGYQIINGYLVGPAPPAPESEHMILFRMERNGERRERMIRISEVDAYRRDAEANNWTYQIINGYLVGPGATPAPESEQPIIFRVRMQDGRVQRIRTTPSQVERDQARARERGWEIVQ